MKEQHFMYIYISLKCEDPTKRYEIKQVSRAITLDLKEFSGFWNLISYVEGIKSIRVCCSVLSV